MKVTDEGVTTSCWNDTVRGEITCEEDYAEVAYIRFTESILNTAIIVPVDKRGRPLQSYRQFIETSSSEAWFL